MPFEHENPEAMLLKAVRARLEARPSLICFNCLALALDAEASALAALVRPRREIPFSFARASCVDCGSYALCVGYAG